MRGRRKAPPKSVSRRRVESRSTRPVHRIKTPMVEGTIKISQPHKKRGGPGYLIKGILKEAESLKKQDKFDLAVLKLDETSRKILDMLAENPKSSREELAEACGISIATVHLRKVKILSTLRDEHPPRLYKRHAHLSDDELRVAIRDSGAKGITELVSIENTLAREVQYRQKTTDKDFSNAFTRDESRGERKTREIVFEMLGAGRSLDRILEPFFEKEKKILLNIIEEYPQKPKKLGFSDRTYESNAENIAAVLEGKKDPHHRIREFRKLVKKLLEREDAEDILHTVRFSPVENRVIELRGILDPPRGFRDIGREIGMCAEGISKVQTRIEKKLRNVLKV